MIIAHIEGATRICGKAQGYLGLPLRDELIDDTVNGEGTPAMVTAWTPTPEELAALNAGASVHVRILGSTPPPMMVMVGPAPDPVARSSAVADATCYVERSKIREILIGQDDDHRGILELVLSEIDALPISTAEDFRAVPQTLSKP